MNLLIMPYKRSENNEINQKLLKSETIGNSSIYSVPFKLEIEKVVNRNLPHSCCKQTNQKYMKRKLSLEFKKIQYET